MGHVIVKELAEGDTINSSDLNASLQGFQVESKNIEKSNVRVQGLDRRNFSSMTATAVSTQSKAITIQSVYNNTSAYVDILKSQVPFMFTNPILVTASINYKLNSQVVLTAVNITAPSQGLVFLLVLRQETTGNEIVLAERRVKNSLADNDAGSSNTFAAMQGQIQCTSYSNLNPFSSPPTVNSSLPVRLILRCATTLAVGATPPLFTAEISLGQIIRRTLRR